MKYTKWIAIIGFLGSISCVFAQGDTLSRSVTVEREFQPIIQPVGKVNSSPARLDIQEPQVEVKYSDAIEQDSSTYNAKPMRFVNTPLPKQDKWQGHLDVAAGHSNTYLDFGYSVPVSGRGSKGVKLDLYAHHDAAWGLKTWEETEVGMNFVKQFSSLETYLNVSGQNTFFTRYGRYWDLDKNGLSVRHFSDLKQDDKQSIWQVNVNVGVRSRKNADILYNVDLGYQAYVLPNLVSEHQARTRANVEWNGDEHRVGGNIYVQNAFYSVEEELWKETSAKRNVLSRHALRINPYYRYVGDRLRARVGVNLDVNFGKGQMMSSNSEISFAPSPDVYLEYRIVPQLLAVYGGAKGTFSTGTLDGYMATCPYRNIARGVASDHVSSYTPVDAFIGFKIRPTDNLLIDIYAGYAFMKNQIIFYTDTTSLRPGGFMHYEYCDYQRWKVGMELTYHYQDIIHITASGNYYHWIPENMELEMHEKGFNPNTVYDHPSWDAHLRIDAHINSQWSLYSDNNFCGSVKSVTQFYGEVKSRPVIDLNIGVRYDWKKNIGFYLQLNNYINRYNDILFSYQTQGIHGVFGVSWKF